MNSAVFLDIGKAFDTVDYQIMIEKLQYHGIADKNISFFSSYLSDQVQCCSVDGVISTIKYITCEVPKGSILGPLIFIIYLNYISFFCQRC